jgi:hypothetical protein
MDASIVERLRDYVDMSRICTDHTLEILTKLDADLQVFAATVRRQMLGLSISDGSTCSGDAGLLELAHESEQCAQNLRAAVRDAIVSVRHQDTIGQPVERAATALEQRSDAIGRVVDQPKFKCIRTDEIAEIHRLYRLENGMDDPVPSEQVECHKAA